MIIRGTARADDLFGTSAADSIYGLGGDDQLEGRGGNDRLFGDRGHDLLVGGLGADTMTGGLGNDAYFVDNAGDRVIETSGQGNDFVVTSISYRLANNVEDLETLGSRHVTLTGNALANTILGNSGNNIIDSGGGADTVGGGRGNDIYLYRAGESTAGERIIDNQGNDPVRLSTAGTYNLRLVMNGIDELEFAVAGQTVFMPANPNFSFYEGDLRIDGSVGLDTLVFRGPLVYLNNIQFIDWAQGEGGDRILINGTAGGDNMSGSSRADRITGGGGQDLLWGNGGADIFVYNAVGDATFDQSDRIFGFSGSAGDGDRIDFSGLANALGVTAIQMVDSPIGVFTAVPSMYLSGTNILIDINGDGQLMEMYIQVNVATSIGLADFIGVAPPV